MAAVAYFASDSESAGRHANPQKIKARGLNEIYRAAIEHLSRIRRHPFMVLSLGTIYVKKYILMGTSA